MSRYFLGIDAGGSRTRAALVNDRGELVGLGFSGPANFRTASFASSAKAVQEATKQALAKTTVNRVQVACIGSAGLEDQGKEEEGRKLLGASLQADRVLLDTDAYMAWAGALKMQAGVIVVAGTGSIGLGVDTDCKRYRVGGWGPYFGDEGSAYRIASRAIQKALMVLDKRGNDHELLNSLIAFAGFKKGGSRAKIARDMTTWLYEEGRSSAEIAHFAKHIDALARQGHQTAQKLLIEAGQDLASLALSAASTWDEPVIVSTGGSVLKNSELVRESFQTTLEQSKFLSFCEPAFPPVIGAVIIALQSEGLLSSSQVSRLEAIVASYDLW